MEAIASRKLNARFLAEVGSWDLDSLEARAVQVPRLVEEAESAIWYVHMGPVIVSQRGYVFELHEMAQIDNFFKLESHIVVP